MHSLSGDVSAAPDWWGRGSERLVEDDNLWMTEECRYNTHFHLVACREIADELLMSEHLAVGEALVDFEALLDLSLFDA